MDEIKRLEDIAKRIRYEALKMIYLAGSGHPGGSLSCVEVITCLYFNIMNIDPKNPDWLERDRFVLSKGHACPAYYAALGIRGFFREEEFQYLRKLDGILEGHPDVRIPGVDAVSGSLGMGLSQGLGMALGGRYLKMNFYTYVLLGDGDMQEGNTWEALMAAGYYKIKRLIAFLDNNRFQGEDLVENTMDYFPLDKKLKGFGWEIIELKDGNNMSEVLSAFKKAKSFDVPVLIIGNTTKGKGISFMENSKKWHGSIGLTDDEFAQVKKELNISEEELR